MRYKIIFSLITTFLIIMFSGLAFQSSEKPRAQISLQSYSPRDVEMNKGRVTKSQGIPNVGIGETVYLLGNKGDNTIQKYSWTLTPPSGSISALSDDSIQNPVFTPDVEGQYEVSLKVTNAEMISEESKLWISAGFFAGAGTAAPTAFEDQCSVCHGPVIKAWQTTGHSMIFQRGIDGHLSEKLYASDCIECHSVGYNKNNTALNGGWDDIAQEAGWTFPENIRQGNFNQLIRNYPDLSNLANVQCENCHGPGSEHLGIFDQNQIVISLSSGVCACCHDSNEYVQPYQWDSSAHAHSQGTPEDLELMNQPGCADCHTGQGFLQVVINGEISDAPYKEVNGITCAVCHDPHDATNKEKLLRLGKVVNACSNCHDKLIEDDSGLFCSSNQGLMLSGKGGMEFEGESYDSSEHSEIEKKCVQCHMANSPEGVELNIVGGHTYRVTYKSENSTVLNNIGCSPCHEDYTFDELKESQEDVKSLLNRLAQHLPKKPKDASSYPGHPLFPKDPSLNKIQAAASHNYYFVLQDKSLGVHNPVYARELIEASIKQLNEQKEKLN